MQKSCKPLSLLVALTLLSTSVAHASVIETSETDVEINGIVYALSFEENKDYRQVILRNDDDDALVTTKYTDGLLTMVGEIDGEECNIACNFDDAVALSLERSIERGQGMSLQRANTAHTP